MSEDLQLETKIKAVMARVFEVGPETITENTRRRQFERWDSLGHLALLGALQDEFHIEIPPNQALEMETLEDVKRAVASSLGTSART
jgi:acyl carrier protein